MPSNHGSTDVPIRIGMAPAPTVASTPADQGSRHSAGPSAPAELAEVFAKISSCHQLPENWDGEDALPIQDEVASRARALVLRIWEEARVSGIEWQNPSVSPSPDGTLEFSWEGQDRWLLWVLSLGEAALERVTQEGDAPPRRGKVSVEEAVQLALWTLGHAPRAAPVAALQAPDGGHAMRHLETVRN